MRGNPAVTVLNLEGNVGKVSMPGSKQNVMNKSSCTSLWYKMERGSMDVYIRGGDVGGLRLCFADFNSDANAENLQRTRSVRLSKRAAGGVSNMFCKKDVTCCTG